MNIHKLSDNGVLNINVKEEKKVEGKGDNPSAVFVARVRSLEDLHSANRLSLKQN